MLAARCPNITSLSCGHFSVSVVKRDGQQLVSSLLLPSAALLGVLGSGRCAVKEAPFLFVTCEPEVIAHACVVPLTAEIESQLSQEAGGCSIWNPPFLFLNL